VTSRGFVEEDMVIIADCIDSVLKAIDTDDLDGSIERVKERIAGLVSKYPLPY
jgi:glycine/serine hydroxymethyltransferase